MSIQLKKVNNYKIKCPALPEAPKKWKGSELFSERYWTCGILGMLKSGKTSLVYTLLKAFVTKNTRVLFFVSTFQNDSSYRAIEEFLNDKGISYEQFDSIHGEAIEAWMKQHSEPSSGARLGRPSEKEKDEEECEQGTFCNFGKPEKKDPRAERGSGDPRKEKPPEYIFVFDDMSKEIRLPQISSLVKRQRHFKARIIISTQDSVDIQQDVWTNMKYAAIFKNFNERNLENIYDRLAPKISWETFKVLYEVTGSKTGKLNNFLLFDKPEQKWRINLNEEIEGLE